ncbi:hypothetical protein MRS44_016921 [Fusarium solani]|uniref:uncharacterized protein n=1 Tax=Fusarium solani TaxID=169388 RepID=UPI0032C43179|nr:hypothetical protein MRS44_016921 [Fusarium solani]
MSSQFDPVVIIGAGPVGLFTALLLAQLGLRVSRCWYLVGADGGTSAVRRNLGIELEGYTWEPWLFVAVDFQYSLGELGWKAANFIVDPEDWGFVIKRGKGASWRMMARARKAEASAGKTNTLDKVIVEAVKSRLRRLLPGDTSSIQYEAVAPILATEPLLVRISFAGLTSRAVLRSKWQDSREVRKSLQKRAEDMTTVVAADGNSMEYVFWQDMTPKNLDFFFRDTQFSGGSWHRYKAVEAFDFDREDAAVAFLDRYRDKITENGNRQVTVVVGERDDIVTSWVE